MYLISVWGRYAEHYRGFIGRSSFHILNQTYHNLSAVREVEVADPVDPEKFPDLHQTVALL